MHLSENTKYILAAMALVLCGASFFVYTNKETLAELLFPAAPKEETHVHADFLVSIHGTKADFTAERYQSSKSDVKHPNMHLHDGIDTMLHRHAPGITLGSFFDSIGITLTAECLTLDTGVKYCSDSNNQLRLIVNGELHSDPASYIIEEADRILLFYGNENAEDIAAIEKTVSDEACIYSGTCPERGTPPQESCGITCEI